jgi:hypothetical protein
MPLNVSLLRLPPWAPRTQQLEEPLAVQAAELVVKDLQIARRLTAVMPGTP